MGILTSATLTAARCTTSVDELTKWRAHSFCFSQVNLAQAGLIAADVGSKWASFQLKIATPVCLSRKRIDKTDSLQSLCENANLKMLKWKRMPKKYTAVTAQYGFKSDY